MKTLLMAGAASLMLLGSGCFYAQAAQSGTGSAAVTNNGVGHTARHRTIHRPAATTQNAINQGGEITSFSSSSAGGVGVVHPPRK